jgi:hypothetical protein
MSGGMALKRSSYDVFIAAGYQRSLEMCCRSESRGIVEIRVDQELNDANNNAQVPQKKTVNGNTHHPLTNKFPIVIILT